MQALGQAGQVSPEVMSALQLLVDAQGLLAPGARRSQLLRALERGCLGAAIESLHRDLAMLASREFTPSDAEHFAERLRACEVLLHKVWRRKTASSVPGRRRGRVLRSLTRFLRPLRAWGRLPGLAQELAKSGHAAIASQLREALQELTVTKLSKAQHRLLVRLDADLTDLETSPPSVGELLRALDLLEQSLKAAGQESRLLTLIDETKSAARAGNSVVGAVEHDAWHGQLQSALRRLVRAVRLGLRRNDALGRDVRLSLRIIQRYLNYGRVMARVQADLSRLIDSPAPRLPLAERRLTQLENLALRWSRAGLRLALGELRAAAPYFASGARDEAESLVRTFQRLLLQNDAAGQFAAMQQALEQVAAWPLLPVGGKAVSSFLAEVEQTPKRKQGAPDQTEPLSMALSGVADLAAWIVSLRAFVERRMQAWQESGRNILDELAAERRFAATFDDPCNADDLTAWLLALPAAEREYVLEILQLGPVRAETVEASLSIAAAEALVRRYPRPSLEDLAKCAVAIEWFNAELGATLRRELFEPQLSWSEQKKFDEHRQALQRQATTVSGGARKRLLRSVGEIVSADDGALGPFFETPGVSGERLELARRRASLELSHSLWRMNVVPDRDYRSLIDLHWRRSKSRTARYDADCARRSIVELMADHARKMGLAAEEAGAAMPSVPMQVWAVWRYLKAAEEISARWREYVPSGARRPSTRPAPQRILAEDPYEMIEFVTVLTSQFFGVWEIIPQARSDPALVTEEEFHAIRLMDTLLFDLFGDLGMQLPSATYAAPLAEAVKRALAAMRPLANEDPDVGQACNVLELLATFHANYQPWAETLKLRGWEEAPAKAIARWQSLLVDIHAMARRMVRAPRLAGPSAPAWRRLLDLLDNPQAYRKLQLALRVAMERDDPACRHLVSSPALLAQHAAERVGLALRRRLHPRSEAAIIGSKLRLRRQSLLESVAAVERYRPFGESLAGPCERLLDLHWAETPEAAHRQAALDCGDEIQARWQELRDAVESDGATAPENRRVVETARAAAYSAMDVVEGFFETNRAKGLRTLIPLRWGERLTDTLSRV